MKIGFIGCGNLAQAIINGLIKKKVFSPNQILAADTSYSKLQAFSKKTKIKIFNNNFEVVQQADVLFLATKPQDLFAAVKEIQFLTHKKQIIISLAAGIKVRDLEKVFSRQPVVRVMASLSAKIQKGIYGIYFLNSAPKVKKKIIEIFSTIGQVVVVKKEEQIDAITAGSASGVGFVFEFMRIFETWFSKNGFSLQQARLMAVETFLGAAALASLEETSLKDLRNAVTSKKGTTLSGLKSMSKSKLDKKIAKALSDAKTRAKELSKNQSLN